MSAFQRFSFHNTISDLEEIDRMKRDHLASVLTSTDLHGDEQSRRKLGFLLTQPERRSS